MNTHSETGERSRIPKHKHMFPFQLMDVRLYEIVVERHEVGEEEELKELPLKLNLVSGDEPIDADEFSLLLTVEIVFPDANVSLGIEGLFSSVVDIDTLKPDLIQRFKSADALLLLWPYMRQTFHDITSRMRLDVSPLPILDASAVVQPSPREEEDDLHQEYRKAEAS